MFIRAMWMKSVKFTCINRHHISLIQAAFVGSSAVFVLPFPITAVSNFFLLYHCVLKQALGKCRSPTHGHIHTSPTNLSCKICISLILIKWHIWKIMIKHPTRSAEIACCIIQATIIFVYIQILYWKIYCFYHSNLLMSS